MFLKQKPNNNDLCFIIKDVHSLRNEAWEILRKQNPTNEELRFIIKYVEMLKYEAEEMLSKKDSNIIDIIKNIKDIKKNK